MSLILIADDHAVAREPLARLLQYEGYETACAANGLEALDAVHQRQPDLIVLDLMMPKMSGIAFLETLREESSVSPGTAGGGDVPVIVLTGAMDPGDLARARELGVREVIAKARFDVDELIRRVEAHLPKTAP